MTDGLYEKWQLPDDDDLVPYDEAEALLDQMLAGDLDARCRFIEANLGLALQIAAAYLHRKHKQVDLGDLISAGCIGIIKATETVNPTLGKFSTHAVPRVKGAIKAELKKELHLIRLPQHVAARVVEYKKTRKELMVTLKREPTPIEIYRVLMLTTDQIKDLEYALQSRRVQSEKGTFTEGQAMAGFLPDTRDTPLDELIKKEERTPLDLSFEELVTTVLGKYPQEMEVITLRFGPQNLPLKEVVKRMGKSHDRVSAVQNRALRRLRKYLEEHSIPTTLLE